MAAARLSMTALLLGIAWIAIVVRPRTYPSRAPEQPQVVRPAAPVAPQLLTAATRDVACTVLEELLGRSKEDASLKPRAGQTVRVEAYEAEKGWEASLHYETPDSWPDLPSKPQGPRPGNGNVQVRISR